MFGWDDAHETHNQVYQDTNNSGNFGHELLAGAASFGAMKMWEDHQRKQGKPVSHAFAKEALAAIAGGEAEKLCETYGKTEWEKHRAREQAQQNARDMYDDHYVQNHGADQYSPDQYGRHEVFEKVQDTNYYTDGQWQQNYTEESYQQNY